MNMEPAKILVCEDERIVAQDIVRALERIGYSVVGVAGNAAQAIKLAEETSPDIALMDIHLEGSINGIEIATYLRNQYNIPSIYLTAYTDPDTLEQAKEARPLGFVVKPFDQQHLKVTLEMALHGHRELEGLVKSLEREVEQLSKVDVVDRAVELEHQYMETERINSCARVAKQIVERLADSISLIGELLEPLSDDPQLDIEKRNKIRGALIHQDQVTEMLKKLRNFTQDSGFAPRELVVHELLREAMDQLPLSVMTPIEFSVSFEQEPLIIVGDRAQLMQTISHVLLNAFQARREQPVIKVSTSLVHEQFPERYNAHAVRGWYVNITIGDLGSGIPAEQLERIFEPFYKANDYPMAEGLGLSMVFGTMQRHLGWVTVKSQEGEGTQVSLFLPRVKSSRTDFYREEPSRDTMV